MRQTFWKAIGVIVLLLPLSSFAAPAKEPANWTPDPAIVRKLSRAVDANGWVFQPPAGYTPIQGPSTDREETYVWMGDSRADHTRSVLVLAKALTLDVLPDENTDRAAILTIGLKALLKGLAKTRVPDLTYTTPEVGRINGALFARAAWKGTTPQGVKMLGITYVTQSGPKIAALTGMDSIEHSKKTFPFFDTSIRTLRAVGESSEQ